jgi:hypothetical protein
VVKQHDLPVSCRQGIHGGEQDTSQLLVSRLYIRAPRLIRS